MADWYYAKDGQQFGPISPAQLKQLASSGGLVPEDLVFQEGGQNWVAASTVKGLFAAAAAAPAPVAVSPAATATRQPAAAARPPAADEGELPEGEYSPARGSTGAGGNMMDYLMMRRMIAPFLVLILFFLMSGITVLAGLGMGLLAMIYADAIRGLLIIASIPIGVLMIRVYCELLIVVFRINETLQDIKELQRKQLR